MAAVAAHDRGMIGGWLPQRRTGALSVMHVRIVLAILAIVWGYIISDLRRSHDRVIADTAADASNLARVFAEMTTRTIDTVDQALLITRDAYARDFRGFDLARWARDRPFMNRLNIQISIVDPNGLVVASNLGPVDGTVNVADREHIAVHTRTAIDQLFISQPVVGRFSGPTSIQLTRPIRDRSGQFLGVVVASIDPYVVSQLYDAAEIGSGFILLAGLDGVVRAGKPSTANAIGSPIDAHLLESARSAQAGSHVRTGAAGGGSIVGFRTVGDHPLFVTVGFDLNEALRGYRTEQQQYLATGIGMTILVLLLSLILTRHRNRVARFQRALAATLENMSQGIFMIDRDGRIPVSNPQSWKLLGLPPRSDATMASVLRQQHDLGEFQADRDSPLATADPAVAPPVIEHTRPDGTILEVRTTRARDGAVVRTFADITERKRFERDLSSARDAAEIASRARADFLANMSHEIRTPLNCVLGSVALIRERSLDPETAHDVGIIQEASNHLLMLVDDILGFVRLDRRQVVLTDTSFELETLIRTTMEMLRSDAHQKGLALTHHFAAGLPRLVRGDPGRLRQILMILLGNGIKFTEAGGVHLAVGPLPHNDSGLRIGITVSDTGIGMSDEIRENLFKEFSQADGSLSRRFSGVGIGLAACHRLIGLMDGTIKADSVPGRGSVFRIELRLGQAEGLEPLVVPPEPDPSEVLSLHILIAEDNQTNLFLTSRLLRAIGHTSDGVDNGAVVLKALRRKQYDLILMDMMMPGMDGLSATRAVRAAEAAINHIPIIGLTANIMPDDERACLEAGMNAFLTKPATTDQLRSAITAAYRASSPPQNPAPDLLDHVHLSELTQRIGEAAVIEALTLFKNDAPRRVTILEKASRERDYATQIREAHALSGSAQVVGAFRLSRHAGTVDQRSGLRQAGTSTDNILHELLDDTLRAMDAWIADRPAQAA